MLAWLRRLQLPHVFTLLTGVILVCSLLTWVMPAGSYQREKRLIGNSERTMVVPGTFQTIPKHYSIKAIVFGDSVEGSASPVSVQQFLSAIPRGMEKAADIIFFIFIVGGVFGILQRTGTLASLVNALLQRFRHSKTLLTVVLMVTIGIAGSTLGMGEELIPLVPIFLLVAKELKYDRIYGLALVLVGAEVGFAAATTNPFTVNIAQGIAELPLNSAIGFRMLFFVACMSVTLIYVLRYGARIQKDPSTSLMADDPFDVDTSAEQADPLNRTHLAILLSGLAVFSFILYAVQEMGWWLSQMAGGFLLIGGIAAVLGRLSLNDTAGAFVKGMEEMVVAALVVGFARGIQVVLEDGQVLDTFIYSAASVLQHMPSIVAAEGMLLFQTLLNFLIPSGSGQAAVTIPLMAPLADVLGLTRQTAVFAFTCGDGFSNTVIPTSGILMAMLSLAKIPYMRWLKFMLPLFLQLMALGAIFLAIAVAIDL